MFNQPAHGSGYLKPSAVDGHLFLILRFHGKDRHFDTFKRDEVDRATVDIVDLDDDLYMPRLWLTHPGLVNKVQGDLPLLGRLGKVPSAKGMAWSFLPFEEGVDDVRAKEWLDAHPDVLNTGGGRAAALPANHQASLRKVATKAAAGKAKAADEPPF